MMNKLKISLENCYGIKKLDKDFDFTERKVKLFYAGNGAMKSSFARVFTDLSKKNKPKDNFFPKRKTKCSILDENNAEIDPNRIFVIDPPQKKYDCKRISTLLVNEELKTEYDEINQKYSEAKNSLLTTLKKTSKFKGDVEPEIAQAFNFEQSDPFNILENFLEVLSKSSNPGYSNISYLEIFIPQVLKFLESPELKKQIIEYVEKFDELVSKCTYFKPVVV